MLECLVGTEEFPYVLHSMNIGYHCQRNDASLLNTSIMPLPLKAGGSFILRQLTKVTNQSSHHPAKSADLHNPRLVTHDNESLPSRLDARNRAMLGLMSIVQFHNYNLVTNNC